MASTAIVFKSLSFIFFFFFYRVVYWPPIETISAFITTGTLIEVSQTCRCTFWVQNKKLFHMSTKVFSLSSVVRASPSNIVIIHGVFLLILVKN